MARITEGKFLDLFHSYKAEPHQLVAMQMLYQDIVANGIVALGDDRDWLKHYRGEHLKQPDEMTKSVKDPFTTYVTDNFQYGEICLWQEARRFKSEASLRTARKLCRFLEKARAHFGCAIIITSGHRPEPINSQVGGAPGSEHTFPAPGVGALDVALERGNQYELQEWIDKHWDESVGYGAPAFVHVGCGRGRRRWDY